MKLWGLKIHLGMNKVKAQKFTQDQFLKQSQPAKRRGTRVDFLPCSHLGCQPSPAVVSLPAAEQQGFLILEASFACMALTLCVRVNLIIVLPTFVYD